MVQVGPVASTWSFAQVAPEGSTKTTVGSARNLFSPNLAEASRLSLRPCSDRHPISRVLR